MPQTNTYMWNKLSLRFAMLYTAMRADILYNPLGDIYFYIYDSAEKTKHSYNARNTFIVYIGFPLPSQLKRIPLVPPKQIMHNSTPSGAYSFSQCLARTDKLNANQV